MLPVLDKNRDGNGAFVSCKQASYVGRIRSPEMEDSNQSEVQFQQGIFGGSRRWKEDTHGGDTQSLNFPIANITQ